MTQPLPVWYLKNAKGDKTVTSNYAVVVKLKRQGWEVYRVLNDPFDQKPVPNPVRPPEPPPFAAESGS